VNTKLSSYDRLSGPGADFGMQHFDNEHLPEPEEHFAEGFAPDAILTCLVAVEAVGLVLMALGAVHPGRWLLA
jgi:hypothetical protein